MTRWIEFFVQFSFELKYKPGVSDVVADALSRPTVCPTTVGCFVFMTRFPTCYAKVLIEARVNCVVHLSHVGEDDEFMQLIHNSNSNDRDCVAVIQALRQSDQSLMARYELKYGLLRVR
ncbi:hypothetical protein PsorP6_015841 [Peronosclerospora sorghi]|uniref:Uncharacterized protein n=1 Tax=Peronosclerospora sorghi TaxID=230839 RepID=A0ACC0WQ40_9STRA|nr:hypothetical protein PsorP6_015841 [Peronosclerospora sorghi]